MKFLISKLKKKVLDSIKNIYNESLELIVDESVDSSIKEQNPWLKHQ
ncbi:MAG: hypothetical protein Ct9H90mP22_0890 [Gammaproteobacteria bacterium]|nr:MAG: hypothetical protein Ct9H90mP22_0890 [Gammaproteobacteria bacterium]